MDMILNGKDIRKIYDLMSDQESQYIFANRLMYSVTEDALYIRNIVQENETGRKIYNTMKQHAGSKAIFGAGNVGEHLLHIYTDIEFSCFIDNKRAGTMYEGLPVVSPMEYLSKEPEGLVIIATKYYWKEILEQLLELGYKKENILNYGEEYAKLGHLQYFDLPELSNYRVEREVFVDGGAYDGSSTVDFLNWCSGGVSYVWEPDLNNIKKCREYLGDKEGAYKLIAKGLWSNKDELKFNLDGTGSSISEEGENVVKVDCIDDCLEEPASFIKMDIEGAEYQALLGAQKTIERYKPKLAICVYHKPEDIWEIPKLINELNSDYRFYLRHYSFAWNETVLYAL